MNGRVSHTALADHDLFRPLTFSPSICSTLAIERKRDRFVFAYAKTLPTEKELSKQAAPQNRVEAME